MTLGRGERKTSAVVRVFSMILMAVALVAQPFLPVVGVLREAYAASITDKVVINEIFPSPTGGADEWIELYNPTGSAVDLSGWKLKDSASYSKSLSGSIAPDGFVTFDVDSFNNSGDTAVLHNGTATVDSVEYSTIPNNNSYARIYNADSVFEIRSGAGVTKNASNGETPHTPDTLDPANVYVGGTITDPTDAEGTQGRPFNTLAAAYAAVVMGGTIHVLSGAYAQAGTLLINKQVIIDGEAGATITASGGANVFTVTASGTVISGLNFVKSDSTTQAIIGVQAPGVIIRDNMFSGQYTLATDAETSRAIVTSSNASGITISGNQINNMRQPAYLNNGSGGTIINNYVNESRGWVVEKSSHFTFVGNTWGNNFVDIAIIPGADASALNNYPCEVTNSFKLTNNNADIDNQAAACTLPDATPPTVPTGGQPHNSFKNTNSFYFTWNESTDDSPGNVRYEFQSSMNGAQSDGVLTTGLWKSGILPDPTIHSVGAPDGKWYWQVRAIDTEGNKSAWSSIWNMTIDTIKPATPALVSPANNTLVKGKDLTHDWQEVNGAHHYVYQSFNVKADGSCNLNSKRFEGEFTQSNTNTRDVADLSFCWRVKAVDTAENSSDWSTLWKTIVDSSAPDVEITSHEDDQGVKGVVNLVGTITDKHPQASYFRITGPNDYVKASYFGDGRSEHQFSWDTDEVAEGTYKVLFEAKDKAGNKDEGSITYINVRVDRTAPEVDITKPTIHQFLKGVIEVEGTVSEPGSSLKEGRIELHLRPVNEDGECGNFLKTEYANVDEEGNWRAEINTAGLDGRHCITALAVDEAGNDNSSGDHVKSFIVDNTAPVITNLTEDLPSPVSGIQEFNFEIVEKWPARITVALNNGAYEEVLSAPAADGSAVPISEAADEGISGPIPLNVEVDTRSLPNGTNRLMVEVVDQAGSRGSLTIEFEAFNPTPPEEEPNPETPEEEPGGFQPPDDRSVPEPIDPITVTISNADLFDPTGAPVIDEGDESQNEENDGKVLGTTVNGTGNDGDADKVTIENAANQGLAWYWWVVIVLSAFVSWLIIAAVSRRLRGQEAS